MRAVTEPDTWPALAERLDAVALRGELEAALDQLPARHREAVQMRVVEELDYPELAARLDVTETTARKRVSLGLQLLRRRMEATWRSFPAARFERCPSRYREDQTIRPRRTAGRSGASTRA